MLARQRSDMTETYELEAIVPAALGNGSKPLICEANEPDNSGQRNLRL
jgi:hypothetical protein